VEQSNSVFALFLAIIFHGYTSFTCLRHQIECVPLGLCVSRQSDLRQMGSHRISSVVIFSEMERISYRMSASVGVIVDIADRSTMGREITFSVVDWRN
jgi:hypothetical protein